MHYLTSHLADFRHGLWLTIELIFAGWIGATVLGALIATMRISPIRTARFIAAGFVLVFRNIPLPVQMVAFAFGFPLIGIKFSLFISALAVLMVYTAPFIAEMLRSGVNNVSAGELEASRALGFSPIGTTRYLLLPQAFTSTVVPMGNLLIMTFKNTSVAAVVGVGELTFTANKVAIAEVQPFIVLGAAALTYVVIGLLLRRGVTLTNKKVAFAR